MSWDYCCLITVVVLIRDHRPWPQHKWWEEAKASAYEITEQVTDHDDSLLKSNLRNMCMDAGREHHAGVNMEKNKLIRA